MKAIATLILIVLTGISAQAQEAKVATLEMGIVTLTEIVPAQENSVARLYKFKNSLIKKELSFSTKRNGSKLA